MGRTMPSRPPKAARPRATRATSAAPAPADPNALAAGWLFDYAALQEGERRRQAYTRAAYAVLGTTEPIDELHRAGELQSLRYVGPSSARILQEVIETGVSATVEAAIAARGGGDAVAEGRSLRSGFLSMAAAERVLAEPRPGVVGLADYAGDLQMHSEWSDGDQALPDIAVTGLRLGYRMAAVTDHSHGLPIARGMSMADAERQHAAVDAVNRANAGHFVLLKGIEANILADGTTDLTFDERRLFDIVVAAPHSALRSRADQTARMVAAVSQPGVDILGHPRGRKYNTRPGVQADWGAVFEAAAAHGVAVEIDGSPERQDLDWELARAACDAGCLFALDSDGHTAAELLFARLAVAHARLAGIPPDRVVNCWTVERLLEWTSGHRGGTGR
jgi:putative hydrolase